MRRELILAEVARNTWAIEQQFGSRFMDTLARIGRGESASDSDLLEVKAVREARAARRLSAGSSKGGIAVIPVAGVILPKGAGMLTDISGATSCQALSSMLRDAVADESVGQILLDFDSPGGSVSGVPELYSEILQARVSKPIVGIANFQAASAAYWLACACSELFVSPSGEVGSVGVYVSHEDVSEAMAKEGVKTTLVSAGKYKTELSPYGPLSPDAKGFMQDQVNEFYRSFVTAVARGRGVSIDAVKNGFGQGRMLTADAAKREGMVDGIADINSLISDMQKRPRSTRTGRSAQTFAAVSLHHPRSQHALRNERELQILSL